MREDSVGELLPPKEPQDGPSVPTSFRVPKAMLDELDALSRETGHSRNSIVVRLVRFALTQYRGRHRKGRR